MHNIMFIAAVIEIKKVSQTLSNAEHIFERDLSSQQKLVRRTQYMFGRYHRKELCRHVFAYYAEEHFRKRTPCIPKFTFIRFRQLFAQSFRKKARKKKLKIFDRHVSSDNNVILFQHCAASLAQSFKAPFPITQVGSSNPHQCIVFEHMQAGDKNADSA